MSLKVTQHDIDTWREMARWFRHNRNRLHVAATRDAAAFPVALQICKVPEGGIEARTGDTPVVTPDVSRYEVGANGNLVSTGWLESVIHIGQAPIESGEYVLMGTTITGERVVLSTASTPSMEWLDFFPTSGGEGSSTGAATWRYEVRRFGTAEVLLVDVDPTEAPHRWRRIRVGRMTDADFGIGFYYNDQLYIAYCNETIITEACPTPSPARPLVQLT